MEETGRTESSTPHPDIDKGVSLEGSIIKKKKGEIFHNATKTRGGWENAKEALCKDPSTSKKRGSADETRVEAQVGRERPGYRH